MKGKRAGRINAAKLQLKMTKFKRLAASCAFPFVGLTVAPRSLGAIALTDG